MRVFRPFILFFLLGLLFSCQTENLIENANGIGPNTESNISQQSLNAELGNKGFEKQDNKVNGTEINLWATYYYAPIVKGFAAKSIFQTDLIGLLTRSLTPLTVNGSPLFIKKEHWCDAAIEGTIVVETEDYEYVSINVNGKSSKMHVDCRGKYSRFPSAGRTVFQITNSFWGLGTKKKGSAKRFNIVPFRSLATDVTKIPAGTVLFIQDAVGTKITLPSGKVFVHDGYFMAADTGGAIKNLHIDVQTGNGVSPFKFTGSSYNNHKKFKAIIVDNPIISSHIEQLHYQRFENPDDLDLTNLSSF